MAEAGLHFEDTHIGDDIGPVRRVVTGEQVREFVRISGPEHGPSRFTDREVARRDGLPGPIVPGAMSVAMMAQLVTGWSSAVALRKVDVIFRQVVLHDAALEIKGIVTDKDVVDGEPRVECDIFVENEEGAQLVIGKATIQLPTREP